MEPRKATIIDIARQLKVSKSTVSRALSGHRSIGLRTRTRVQQLAKELGYEPNQTAIFFKQRRTHLIGVVLPSLSNTFFSSIVSGVEDICYARNYTLILGQSGDDEEREKKIVGTMKDHRVDGMLISMAKTTYDYAHYEMLGKNNIPTVFFDRIPQMKDIHYIASNLESGLMEAVDYLVEKGHRQIALVNGPEKMPASRERYEAYNKALQRNNIKTGTRYIVNTDISVEGNHAAIEQLLNLPARPTAVIVFNDYVALDVMHCARQHRVKINKEIIFVSFANEAICNYMDYPPLASIEQFPYQQGMKAAETLLELLEHPPGKAPGEFRNIRLPSKLVLKTSK